MLRRHGSLALACLALAALPGTLHAQPSIVDVPCPYGVHGMQTNASSPSYNASELAEQLAGLKYADSLNACVATLPSDAKVDVLQQAGDGLAKAIEELDAIIPTLQPLEDILKKSQAVAQALAATSTLGSCSDLQQAHADIDSLVLNALASGLPIVMTPARTIGAGKLAVGINYSPAEFDENDGQPLSASARVDTHLYWGSIAWGVTDNFDLRAVVPYYGLNIPPLYMPSGKFSGFGDPVIGSLWTFRTSDQARAVLSLDSSLSVPLGDEDRKLGTNKWFGRVGLSADGVISERFGSAVFGSAWFVWRDGGKGGYGLHVGVDLTVSRHVGAIAGAVGEDDGSDTFPADIYGGFRVGKPLRGDDPTSEKRIDGRLTYRRPLTSNGFRPDGWLLVSAQLTW